MYCVALDTVVYKSKWRVAKNEQMYRDREDVVMGITASKGMSMHSRKQRALGTREKENIKIRG